MKNNTNMGYTGIYTLYISFKTLTHTQHVSAYTHVRAYIRLTVLKLHVTLNE